MVASNLKALISSPVFLATKSWCSFCQRTVAHVKKQGVEPRILELDTQEKGEEYQAELTKMTGQSTVPYVFIKGEFIGGFTEYTQSKYVKDLKKQLE